MSEETTCQTVTRTSYSKFRLEDALSSHASYAPFALICCLAKLAPEIQHDDTFRDPVATAIDQYFIDCHFLRRLGSCRLGLNNLNVAVVELVRLCNFYRWSVLLGYTTFDTLDRVSGGKLQRVKMKLTRACSA
jgi:hypothetical protein